MHAIKLFMTLFHHKTEYTAIRRDINIIEIQPFYWNSDISMSKIESQF